MNGEWRMARERWTKEGRDNNDVWGDTKMKMATKEQVAAPGSLN